LSERTFLCDAYGAAAHTDSQAVNSGADQVLSLSDRHHCIHRCTETSDAHIYMVDW